MKAVVFTVRQDEESGWLVASWNDPVSGGITTQSKTLKGLEEEIEEAVRCHFDPDEMPHRVTLHFVKDPAVVLA